MADTAYSSSDDDDRKAKAHQNTAVIARPRPGIPFSASKATVGNIKVDPALKPKKGGRPAKEKTRVAPPLPPPEEDSSDNEVAPKYLPPSEPEHHEETNEYSDAELLQILLCGVVVGAATAYLGYRLFTVLAPASKAYKHLN